MPAMRPTTTAAIETTLIPRIADMLHRRLCGGVRGLTLIETPGQIVLHGEAEFYYYKQLAQTIVHDCDREIRVLNEIQIR